MPTTATPVERGNEHAATSAAPAGNFDMAAVNGGAWTDDVSHGRSSLVMPKAPECDSTCQYSKNIHRYIDYYNWKNAHHGICDFEYEYDYAKLDGWLGFARGIGPSLDPFQPTPNDEVNLSSDSGLYGIYCQVHQNAWRTSNYDIWLVNFYDGVGAGGWGYQLLFLALCIVVPIGVMRLGEALVGMLAEEVVAETATAVADATMIAERAAVEVAGEEAASVAANGAATELEQAVARQSETLVEQSGGSVARAAKSEELLSSHIDSLQYSLDLPAGETDAELVIDAVGSGDLQRIEALDAQGFDGADEVVEALARAGADNAIVVTTVVDQEAENSIKSLVDGINELSLRGVDPDDVLKFTSWSDFKGQTWKLVSRAALAEDPSVASVEQAGRVTVTLEGGQYFTFEADGLVRTTQGTTEILEEKAWEGAKMVSQLRKGADFWVRNEGKMPKLDGESSHLLRQIVGYPQAYDLAAGANGGRLVITEEAFTALEDASQEVDILGFIRANNYRVVPLNSPDWELLRTAFPWLLWG